ncbi:MAG: 2-C-methyl-D-erythritol 4-phosphate cytidylyltransferase [Treponema sp.]|nr:2-C-methyl-D-erythritol 4-phosphate cytidylyltransferase [Treponema sp.]
MNDEKIAVIVLAAGSSSRMGGIKKEFQKLNTDNSDNENRLTVLGSSVKTFASVKSIKIIVIAVQANEEAAARDALPPELFTDNSHIIILVNGGDTRRASVYNALRALESLNPRYVLIHDGARPWISVSLIENIITAVKKYDAVIPLLPITDTPKEITTNSDQGVVFVKRHLKRADVGAAQTPQAFKFHKILRAHKKAAEADEEFTDDAEIWGKFASKEACGQVACIPGEKENRKITFREDLN